MIEPPTSTGSGASETSTERSATGGADVVAVHVTVGAGSPQECPSAQRSVPEALRTPGKVPLKETGSVGVPVLVYENAWFVIGASSGRGSGPPMKSPQPAGRSVKAIEVTYEPSRETVKRIWPPPECVPV